MNDKCTYHYQPSGIELEVCNDIAARQEKGLAKYGVTVANNPLELKAWLQHAYEEALDKAIYLKRAIMEMENWNGQPMSEYCLTHYSAYCDPPWLAIHRESAFELLKGYNLTHAQKTDIGALMAGYCNVLDDAGLLYYGQTEAEAVAKALGLLPPKPPPAPNTLKAIQPAFHGPVGHGPGS